MDENMFAGVLIGLVAFFIGCISHFLHGRLSPGR
jgi:hypothetical protein